MTRDAVHAWTAERAARRRWRATTPPVLLDVRWALGPDRRARAVPRGPPARRGVRGPRDRAGRAADPAGRPSPAARPRRRSRRPRGGGASPGERPVVAYDAVGGMSAARVWWLLRWAGRAGRAAARRRARRVDRGGARARGRVGDAGAGRRRAGAGGAADDRRRRGRRLDRARCSTPARPSGTRGDVEPVDPRAGHIPGAVSVPTAGNLGADGTFLPDDALRARFAGARTGPVAVYCGSGVTAAHEVAALAVVGVEAALYPGSWSQWSNDPDRPVARPACRRPRPA